MKPLKILITAGPTIEYIDPVRFISNKSTGCMGHAIAKSAKKRKHKVTLISGPTNINAPKGIKFIQKETTTQMQKEVKKELKRHNVLIMASAVADFKPVSVSAKKIKSKQSIILKLKKNPDILKTLPKNLRKNKIIVGFALETENLIKNALKKLKGKKLDFIVANKINKAHEPFGGGKKDVYILNGLGLKKNLKKTTKSKIARAILDTVEELCYTPN